jgi:hypothetical protein
VTPSQRRHAAAGAVYALRPSRSAIQYMIENGRVATESPFRYRRTAARRPRHARCSRLAGRRNNAAVGGRLPTGEVLDRDSQCPPNVDSSRPAIAITGHSPTASGRGGSSQTPRSRAYWLLSRPASRKMRRANRARPPRRSRSASALSYSRSTMLAGRCEIDRNRVADPIIATGDDRDAALQRNCAFPLALRHSSGRTACRPIAYPDPARRTTIWAASSKRS